MCEKQTVQNYQTQAESWADAWDKLTVVEVPYICWVRSQGKKDLTSSYLMRSCLCSTTYHRWNYCKSNNILNLCLLLCAQDWCICRIVLTVSKWAISSLCQERVNLRDGHHHLTCPPHSVLYTLWIQTHKQVNVWTTFS